LRDRTPLSSGNVKGESLLHRITVRFRYQRVSRKEIAAKKKDRLSQK
jgi:hypothetical protein